MRIINVVANKSGLLQRAYCKFSKLFYYSFCFTTLEFWNF